MRLTLDALIVLDAVDRRGSFAAAAEELHRVPSAVSYSVQKLEEDLDVLIFDRSGHRARLTDCGRALLEEGRQLLTHAKSVEDRVRKLATGWEPELVLSVDSLIGFAALVPVLYEFYALQAPTRLKITEEMIGGSWDALASRRADLAIGASGEPPSGGGYATRAIGSVDFVFAVAPHHPLAEAAEPITPETLSGHRGVALADSSRNLPPRSLGLIAHQDVLTVPTPQAKVAAQIAGIGIGHLPRRIAEPHLAAGTLVEKKLSEPMSSTTLSLAWRTRERGPALKWFLDRLAKMRFEGIGPALAPNSDHG
jgi:DNA-binding transcriptional LysR family regulator